MNREQIRFITDSHYRKLHKRSVKMAESYDPEAIHLFRVEYKKLRAFLKALSYDESRAEELKVAKKLKKTYALAGTIRDLQLQQERTRTVTRTEPKKPLSYLNILQKEIDKVKPELADILTGHPVAESKKKTNASLPALFPPRRFRDYASRQWASIHAILAGGHFSDEHIHMIRKILKNLFYNLEKYTGPEHTLLAEYVMKGKETAYFAQLLEELGNFQDLCNAIALVKSFWLAHLNTYNRELMEKIKKNWIKEKISRKQYLVKKLKADLAAR